MKIFSVTGVKIHDCSVVSLEKDPNYDKQLQRIQDLLFDQENNRKGAIQAQKAKKSK